MNGNQSNPHSLRIYSGLKSTHKPPLRRSILMRKPTLGGIFRHTKLVLGIGRIMEPHHSKAHQIDKFLGHNLDNPNLLVLPGNIFATSVAGRII
jgi:hypothetical protein